MLKTELFNLFTATTYIMLSRCSDRLPYSDCLHPQFTFTALAASHTSVDAYCSKKKRSSLQFQDQQTNPRRTRVRGAHVQYSRAYSIK